MDFPRPPLTLLGLLSHRRLCVARLTKGIRSFALCHATKCGHPSTDHQRIATRTSSNKLWTTSTRLCRQYVTRFVITCDKALCPLSRERKPNPRCLKKGCRCLLSTGTRNENDVSGTPWVVTGLMPCVRVGSDESVVTVDSAVVPAVAATLLRTTPGPRQVVAPPPAAVPRTTSPPSKTFPLSTSGELHHG